MFFSCLFWNVLEASSLYDWGECYRGGCVVMGMGP